MNTTRQEKNGLEQLTQLWIAANDAKAEQLRETELVLRAWQAANEAKAARIDELELELALLREENAALRKERSESRSTLRAA